MPNYTASQEQQAPSNPAVLTPALGFLLGVARGLRAKVVLRRTSPITLSVECRLSQAPNRNTMERDKSQQAFCIDALLTKHPKHKDVRVKGFRFREQAVSHRALAEKALAPGTSRYSAVLEVSTFKSGTSTAVSETGWTEHRRFKKSQKVGTSFSSCP